MTTKKEKIFDFYVAHRNFFNKGLGEFNQLKELIMLFMIVSLWFGSQNMQNMGWFALGMLTFVAFIFFWFVGFIWDKLGMYHVENEFTNRRNRFMVEMRDKIDKAIGTSTTEEKVIKK